MKKISRGIFIFSILFYQTTHAKIDAPILLNIKDLILIQPDMGDIAPVSGDGVGNGGGPEKALIIKAEVEFEDTVKKCQLSGYCTNSISENFLNILVMNQSKEQLIAFTTSEKLSQLKLANNKEKYFFTGKEVGAPVFINSNLLDIKDMTDAIIYVMSIYSAHYGQYSDEVKKLAISEMISYLQSIDKVLTLSQLGYDSIFALEFLKQNEVVISDSEKSYFLSSHLADEGCRFFNLKFSNFQWLDIYDQSIKAQVVVTTSCGLGRGGERFLLELILKFKEPLLLAHEPKISEVLWQKFPL